MPLKHSPVKVAIIGGGAAGLFAAAVAIDRKLPCLVIERKARVGSKLLMTANGRCNFAKDIAIEEFLQDVGPCSSFVAEAIRECPPRKIIAAIKSLNVPVKRMKDARVFPADGKATSIVHAFGDLLRDNSIPLLTNCAVLDIQPQKNGFIVATKNFTLWAENVLIATGGVSYPKLGSLGDGQTIAKKLGHEIVPYRPGLIGLETKNPIVLRHAGERFESSRARVLSPSGEILFEYNGEIDCETFGLSGAAIYNCQRFIEHKDQEEKNFARAAIVEAWFANEHVKLQGLMSRPLKEAIVTIGGVSRNDINPATMQSRKVPGLYFAGEVMDIDGPTGGYNLTLAFSTARKAIDSIAKKSSAF